MISTPVTLWPPKIKIPPGATPQEVEASVQRTIEALGQHLDVISSSMKRIEEMEVALLAAFAKNPNANLRHFVAGLMPEVRRIANKITPLFGPLSACKNKCSHCCHMAVGIFSGEAESIGKSIGVVPKKLPPVIPEEYIQRDVVKRWINVPCPFLEDGLCSIYEHRPLVCRTHFNLSAFPLLCDTRNYLGNDVPNFNFQSLWNVHGFISLLSGETPGDLREFFPKGLGKV